MLIFADPLPGTPREALTGLGAAVVLRDPAEGRGPGTTAWRGSLPAVARAGDHVLLEAGDTEGTDQARARGVRVWWRCRHPREVRATVAAGQAAWLQGAEAGGRTGRTTGLVLMRALADPRGRLPDIPWVVAGLTPGARAASIAIGAAGLVLDTELWDLPGSPLHPERRAALRRAGARDTHLIGDVRGQGVRVWLPRDQVVRWSDRVRTEGLDGLLQASAQWWTRASGPAACPVSLAGAIGQGSAASRVRSAVKQARRHLAQVAAHHPLRPDQDPLGTGTPIVQGPMANVAEKPGLARAVRAAGGLPFVALGALRPDEAEAVLDAAPDGCGAGLIAFDVAPHRDAHIDALVSRGPRPVILAGGSPTLARSLAERGLDPWLHTPSARLAGFAVGSGIGAVVLEGHEAGGHVGPVPATALWDTGLSAVVERMDPERPPLVVLAGGIGDAISAAFAAALAAPAAAAGARIALQAGTAFFFTREIVDEGQLTRTCQDLAIATEDTVLVGESVNLPLRCAPNAFTTEAREHEATWSQQGLELRERRTRMERQNLGRTRIAAKGIERDPDWDGRDPTRRHRPVPEDRARREGAYTLGQGATVRQRISTVVEVIDELTEGARRLLARASRGGRPISVPGAPSEARRGPEIAIPLGRLGADAQPSGVRDPGAPIAIVGLGCVLPGGPDLLGWWHSQLRGVDAVRPIPGARWDPARYSASNDGASGPAKSASVAAGVAADVAFDPLRYRIPPNVLPTVDRAQRLALLAGDEALLDAGLADGVPDPTRAAVILGNAMGGEWRSKMAVRVRFREVLDRIGVDPPEREALEQAIEARLDEEIVPLKAESMVGLLGNVAAGRVAAWLDWQGGNHTVDAACAASLLAITHAVDALRAGRVDVVLTGGVDTDLAIDTYVGFSRTRALSTAGSRPFSRDADGFVMGEGAASFVLTRLEDAARLGLPVWAVIHGVGTSSDGRARGLTAPRPEGQRLAIRRAWEDAGHDPRQASYVEAHGTGTTLGDRTEASVLAEIFGEVWAGTAKGAVGHLKSAAGAAGLLRAVLATATGVLPPTAHVGPPIDEARQLRLARRPTRPDGGVALAGVSAFGFGGTNAHLVISAPPPGLRRPAVLRELQELAEPFLVPPVAACWTAQAPASPASLTPSPVMHLFAAADRTALATAVRRRRHAPARPEASLPVRLAVLVDPLAHPDAEALLDAVADALEQGADLPGTGRAAWLDDRIRDVIVVAPGQGAQRAGALASVSRFAAAEVQRELLQQALGGSPTAPDDADTRALHRHLYAVSGLWAVVLRQAGLPVHAALGHSLGEAAALVAAGRADLVALAPVVRARGEALHDTAGGAMLVLLGPRPAAESLAAEHGLHLAARNSPRATVVGGSRQDVRAAAEAASDVGLRAVRVDVAHAFHGPDQHSAVPVLARALAGHAFEPGPWWSALGGPRDPAAALVEALTRPVDFGPTLARHASADALVLELGPGRSLSAHARALGLRTVALDPDPERDPHGPVRAAAALWASGRPQLLEACPGVDVRIASSRRPLGLSLRDLPRDERPAAAPVSVGAELTAPPPTPTAPAPRPTPGSARQAVLDALVEITGYPSEVLARAGDLQADLGVDSVQRLEVVGLLQERLGLSLSADAESRLEGADLDGLVAVIARSLQGEDAGAAAPTDPLRALRYVPVWQPIPAPAAPDGWSGRGEDAVLSLDAPQDGELVGLLASTLTRLLQAPQDASRWVIVVPDHPLGTALGAAARAVGGEHGVACTVVLRDASAPDDLPPIPPGACFRHHAGGLQQRRWRPVPTSEALPSPPRALLATGGLRGILPALIRALAPERVVVLGRTPAEDLLEALAELRQHVPDATYVQADVTSPEQVQHAVDRLGQSPDHILHGAAVLRDQRAADLTPDDLRAVVGPKLGGLHVLRAAAPEARLTVLSSLAAHAPSPGQAAYAAANAACECLADHAIALTAVEERGLAASAAVRAALRARGVRALPLSLAAEAVRDSLHAAASPCLITADPPPDALPPELVSHRERTATGASLHLQLDPAQPELADHVVAGRSVVPAATWLDLALAETGHVEAFQVRAPLFVERRRADVRVDFAADDVAIHAGPTRFATARLGPRPAPPEASPDPRAPASCDARDLYRSDLLFHGPHWRVLDRVWGDGNGTLTASLRPGSRSESAVDAAHQLLACWSATALGWMGLPVGARAWTRYSDAMPTRLRVRPHATEQGDELLADVIAWDASDRIVLWGEGVHLRRAAPVSDEARAALDDAGLTVRRPDA